jgi:hypothetical protein
MTFYRDKKFIKLKCEWYSKLKDNGFKDLEDTHGRLKQPEKRTIAYNNKERIFNFYMLVGEYINQEPLKPKHKLILYLWSQGRKVREIQAILGKPYSWLHLVIGKHKKIIKSRLISSEEYD